MGEKEDKEKAEKLAAAKKRVAQLKKQKQKAAGDKEKKPAKGKEETAQEPTSSITDEPSTQSPEDGEVKSEEKAAKATEEAESATAEEAIESTDVAGDTIPEDASAAASSATRPGGHGRQPSLSLQSKMRSSSFRRTSTGPSVGSPAKSPTTELPPMTPDNITDIYRKQASRLEELERENKRLEKEAAEGESRWRKSEEELEELRESNTESVALRGKVKKGEEAQKELQKLRAEVSSLQRQHRSQSVSKPVRSPSIGTESAVSPDPETKALLSSKDATITDMELEISNLRAQLSDQTSSCTTHGSQIAGLTTQLSSVESKNRDLTAELADVKRSLTRASEKAVKEGVERTSSDTKIRSLERDLTAAKQHADELVKKAETLEKKIEAMNKVHRESEARMQSKLVTAEKEARDLIALKKKIASLETENGRLKDERERRKRKEASNPGEDAALDELEDEERQKLERRIRDLEGENFDLKRGVWKERRKELQGSAAADGEADASTVHPHQSSPSATNGTGAASRSGFPDEDFDEVDLSGGLSNRRRSLLAAAASPNQQKHSTISAALTSSLAAFRGTSSNLLEEDDELLEDDDDDADAAFDEKAFARAQREEEARKMVEHVREVKKGLKENWSGWRLDLTEARRGLVGSVGPAGGMIGEIFEV